MASPNTDTWQKTFESAFLFALCALLLAIQPKTASAQATGSAACGDYDTCLQRGIAAFKAQNWQVALADFQGAAEQKPTAGEPWAWLGNTYLASGQINEAPDAWDKALRLGSPVVFNVCHERGMKRCETGDLSLSAKRVSFTAGGDKEFDESSANVSSLGPTKSMVKSPNSLSLQVTGKAYDFDFFPFGMSCGTGSFLHCPQDGQRQQIAIRDYVSNVVAKLSSMPQTEAVQSKSGTKSQPQANVPTGFYPPTGDPVPAPSLRFLEQTDEATFAADPIHLGVDWPLKYGSPLYSIADGQIVLEGTGLAKYGGLALPGNALFVKYITASGQPFYALYAHIENMKPVGTCVKRGEQIATVGHYYNDKIDAPHIHFAVFFGEQLPDVSTWRQYVANVSDNPGYQDPAKLLKDSQPGNEACINPTEFGPGVVLANTTHENRLGNKGYAVYPFLRVTSGQYQTLPDGTSTNSLSALSNQDYGQSGINQSSPKVQAALRASPLNEAKAFVVYRDGKGIGVLTVKNLIADEVGAPAKVLGVGRMDGLTPRDADTAVAGKVSYEGLRSITPLTAVQLASLKAKALTLMPKTVPPNKVKPDLAGKAIVVGKTEGERTEVFDLDRDGSVTAMMDLVLKLRTATGTPLPKGFADLLATYSKSTGTWTALLSSATASDGEALFGDHSYQLMDVLDIDGDGNPELIFSKSYNEVGDLEIYRYSGGRLSLLCTIRGWWGT